MRLLFVIDSFGSGGAQRQMVQLALGFQAAGHEVSFFVYVSRHDHFRRVIDAAGIPVHEYEKPSRYSPRVVLQLARVIREGRFDVVLAYLTTPSLYAELASLLNRLRGVRTPVVVSERGPLPHLTPRLRLMLGAHRFADRIVTNSRNNREQLLSVWPALRARTAVIYNGVDLATFAPGSIARPQAAGQLAILAIGTLLPTKDAMVLVEALALHRAQHGWTPTVSWVGKLAPHGGDAAYEQRVKARIEALGLAASWIWMHERHDVPDLLRSHDVLVHPSILEGLPNAVCEALASGLPVIAARIGDNDALVQPGVTGFLYPASDAAALAGCIAAFASMTAGERQAMSSAARAFAVDSLGLPQCVASYEGLFRELAGAHAR